MHKSFTTTGRLRIGILLESIKPILPLKPVKLKKYIGCTGFIDLRSITLIKSIDFKGCINFIDLRSIKPIKSVKMAVLRIDILLESIKPIKPLKPTKKL